MLPSPVKNAWTAVVAEPVGKLEGGKTRTAVSISNGGVAVISVPEHSPEVSLGETLAENDIGLSMIAIHRAMEEYSWALVGTSDRGTYFRVDWIWETTSGVAMIKLQVSLSGTSSSSTSYLGVREPSEVDVVRVLILDIRLPRIYMPPETAAIRQKPWAISPVPP